VATVVTGLFCACAALGAQAAEADNPNRVNLPDVKERILGRVLTPVGSTPEQMSALIKEEAMEYGKLVKQIGFQPI